MQTNLIYHKPKKDFVAVLSIPHSGEFIPKEIGKYLIEDTVALSKDVDTAVDSLIDIEQLTDNGIAVIISKMHRAAIDINRSRDKALLCWKQNTWGEQLVISEPSIVDSEKFLTEYYDPYYTMLTTMVAMASKSGNPTPFVDLHSMPSAPTSYHLKLNPTQNVNRADFCISDLDGQSCPASFINFISDELKLGGYSTAINDPYFGGYVTQYVNQLNSSNIQIEINRRIYLEESTRTVNEQLRNKLKPILTDSLIRLLSTNNLKECVEC